MENNILLEWEAYEFPEKQRKPDWFWAIGIIGVAGSTTTFIFGNFLFGIFIILASVAMMYFGSTKPKKIKYSILQKGIIHENRFYPYERLKSFWLTDDGIEKKLLIKSDKTFNPILSLPFEEDETGDQIYDTLIQIMLNEEIQESFANKIMNRLDF